MCCDCLQRIQSSYSISDNVDVIVMMRSVNMVDVANAACFIIVRIDSSYCGIIWRSSGDSATVAATA